MTESDRIGREERYRGPLPGEVPLSRDSRAGGPTPGLVFDDVTGRVVPADSLAQERGTPAPASEPGPPSPSEPEPEPEPEPPSSSGPGSSHVPDRPPSREQRRTDGRAMVPLLARALATQLEQVAADDDSTPDGWWFTPDTDR